MNRPDLGVTAVMLPELDFAEQISLCASLGIRCYQYRPRIIKPDQRGRPFSPWGNHRFDLTPDRLRAEGTALTRQLEAAGLAPWGTLPEASIDDTDDALLAHLRGAAEAGAGRMRCSPTPLPQKTFDYPKLLESMRERFAHIIERLAHPLGIKLIVETHTRSLASSPGIAWALVRGFDPRDIGVIFDVANFAREGELQPALAVSVLRDYIDCVHIGGNRRETVGTDAEGCRVVASRFCPLEDGDLNPTAWVGALRETGVAAPLIIEEFTENTTGTERLRRSARLLTSILDQGPG